MIAYRESWKISKHNSWDTYWNEVVADVIESACVFPAMTGRHGQRASSPFCMWISFWTGSRYVPFTPVAHDRPRSQVRACRTYVIAPYGRMLCAMLGSWHCPRVNGQTLVNPAHSLFSWDRAAQVAMEMGGLWLLRGNEKKGRGHKWLKVTSQIEVSGVSWQWIWLLVYSSYKNSHGVKEVAGHLLKCSHGQKMAL